MLSYRDKNAGTAPKIYQDESLPDYWIAQGTDGSLYRVPTEPGGWIRRDLYQGNSDGLRPIPAEQARTSIWFVYGDIGMVTIEHG